MNKKSSFFKIFYLIAFTFLTCSFSFIGPELLKKISDKEFRYEFYTSTKEIKTTKNRNYYWFKGGAIHVSEYGISGEILNGIYIKYYLDNQLAERGNFSFGVKNGEWKSWHKNGQIQTLSQWSKGLQRGKFLEYNNDGKLILSGKFKHGKKEGAWIYHTTNDTIHYKKGEIFVKPKKLTKEEKQKQKELKKKEKAQKKINKKKKQATKKQHWWSKYFKKKNGTSK